MTFHAGNGVTLTKEEENLPEEEKQKLIRQKEEQLNYERHVDDDLKGMVDRGDAAALADENAKMDKKLGGAKDYGLGNIDGSKTQEAVDLVGGGKSKTASGQHKAGDKSAQQTEYRQGAFGTLKNEDFTQYRKDKAARQAAAREARRASDEAMAAKRKDLLASGEYFDNGRGQILRKKQYRQYLAGDQRHRHLRTATDNGAGMAAIREAGKAAWDEALARQNDEQTEGAVNYSRSAVQANRLAAKERKAAKAEAVATSAKAKLSVFDGFAAALDALNADAANAEDNVVSVWGGKDENGRDARWTYDDQGRITGQANPRQVVRGKRLESGGVQQTEGNYRKGFVDPVVLKAINSQLQKRGANYAVTGIMARQAYGAIGKPVKGSKPMFYIQGLRNDGTQFGQYMTIDDVYRWGVENYRAANGSFGNPQKFAAEALGGYDPEGVLGMSEKERIAMMNDKTKRLIAEREESSKHLPKSKEDFISEMLKSGNVAAHRLATEDDVANKLATTIGESIERTQEEMIEYLGNIYDKIYRNQDPALGGGQGGGSPIVVSPFDPLHPDNPAITPPATAQQPKPQVGGQAQAQTAAPSPSATAQPPAEGQGELDFGGGEPEAGNLTHEGRKWKLYTDANGKVSGYGTTRSMVTKTDDGRFAVIPTIVNGEELSEADALAHFKETGEHWGIVKTEDEAKKLAEKVHLDGQEHERAAWNDYIQNHWDEMSDEIRNDPGVAEERKRRQAAKPKSNSWKNSALFK